jgi:hypothetical protein
MYYLSRWVPFKLLTFRAQCREADISAKKDISSRVQCFAIFRKMVWIYSNTYSSLKHNENVIFSPLKAILYRMKIPTFQAFKERVFPDTGPDFLFLYVIMDTFSWTISRMYKQII